jgi:histidyl-tRNA synthetase
MKTIVPTVKGSREFYPEDMARRVWLYQSLRQVSESYGFQEYDGPFLEKIDLYAAKSGEELVNQQSFVFQDRGGDKITLRPELTPSLARMVAQKQGDLTLPLRWWSFGPFWRYERPQKGRTREFFQWNIDIIGVDTPEADAELVSIAAAFLEKVGLTPDLVQIKVNNRQLMDAQFTKLGISPELKGEVLHLIDRRDKMAPDAWEANALEIGLKPAELEGLKALLTNPDLWKEDSSFNRFFAVLDAMGYRDYVSYDPQIIRGLDYYTGTVFEAREKDGGRAVLGGGHYGNLVGDVGGEPMPGVGFAMGDVMMLIVLEKYDKLPAYVPLKSKTLVTVFDAELLPRSFALAAELRREGLPVVCYPDTAKLPKQLKYADKMGLRFALIMGPDEAAEGKVTVKDLANRTQETVLWSEVAGRINRADGQS